MIRYAMLRTALDPILALSGPRGLVRLEFLPRAWEYHTRAHALARTVYSEMFEETVPDAKGRRIKEDETAFTELRDQLAEYFTGQREIFTLDLELQGTPFQIRVWTQLLKIPFGKVRTYGQIARSLRKAKATRAVGQAAGHNPLPILVPCHRVVGQGGSLVGFAGGISTKARLLRLEGHTLGENTRIEEPRLF